VLEWIVVALCAVIVGLVVGAVIGEFRNKPTKPWDQLWNWLIGLFSGSADVS
jgi:cytochrome bd-type quinol oxidase subunit 2